jgi:hypothetical protein
MSIKTIYAGIGALALIGGLAACGSASSSPASAPATSAPATSGSGGGRTATASVPSPSPSGTVALALAQQEQSWCSATGGTDMSTVATDLNSLSTDTNNDSLTGIASDGNSLYYDADTAWYDPVPPIDPADWQNAMNDYTVTGADYSRADITDGNASLNGGSAAFSSWTTAVTTAGSVCAGNYYEPGFGLTASGPAAATPMTAPYPAFSASCVDNAPPPYGSGEDTVKLSIMGIGIDNAYSQATVTVSSGSWSQTITVSSASGWQYSLQIPSDEGGSNCSALTQSAS